MENIKRNIAIVCGGDSSEHDVSMNSANGLYSFFDKERYNVYIVDVEGQNWHVNFEDGTTAPVDRNDFSFVKDGKAVLADGTIACSATNLWTCLQNVLKWNVPEEEAIRAATFNPAKAIGAADKVGTIETGKLADFVVTNADYTQKRVFIGGKEI